jgi:hypothetical protein
MNPVTEETIQCVITSSAGVPSSTDVNGMDFSEEYIIQNGPTIFF